MLTVSDRAKKRISSIATETGKSVRLMITSGGCQGFNKVWDLEAFTNPDDVLIDCGSATLLIDQSSMDILANGYIDYVTDLSGQYFTVTIPEATSTCGCGTSFSL